MKIKFLAVVVAGAILFFAVAKASILFNAMLHTAGIQQVAR